MSFNSNTSALEKRINANRNTLVNLEDWIFDHLSIKKGMRVLDVGCGTGKQTFYLQNKLSSESEIVGSDISEQSVESVKERAIDEKIHNISAIQVAHDDLVNMFQGKKFDLIVSTYSIYYSKDVPKLIESLPSILNDEGQVFLVGNGKGSNIEMYDLLSKIAGREIKGKELMEDFINQKDIELTAKVYSSNSINRLKNKIFFSSTQAIISWWENHNSYIREAHQEMASLLDKHFQKNNRFELTKNVLGVNYQL